MDIFLIGTGNVAFSLIQAFQKQGHNVKGVFSRTKEHTKSFCEKFSVPACYDLSEIPSVCDFYFICTSDYGIESAAEMLKEKNGIKVHTSGSTQMTILQKFSKDCGVMYPVQTFSKSKTVDFKNVPLLIEASSVESEAKLMKLALSLSSDVRKMTSVQRRFLHLAAVFACNFTNHFIAVSKMLTTTENIDFDLLKPLIQETMQKALTLDPVKNQSGPAQRDDSQILNLHLEMLKDEILLKKIYSFVSSSIVDFRERFKNGI
ncbi:MAG: DUF2520 domain-containing protein [Bacteroidales bacterium]|nr:DUF2520 domain-containing protein [Bacteroidales bacterium]